MLGAERRLHQLWSEIRDLNAAEELLAWDQETYMPAGGQPGRGRLLATVAGLKSERLKAPELADCLEACAAGIDADPTGGELAAQLRHARRIVERARRIPTDLARAMAAAGSAGVEGWRQAHAERSFAPFAPHLARLLELKREAAAAIDPAASPYDVLLDEFEPGATSAELTPLFAELQERLTPLVLEVVGSGAVVDESPALGHFPRQQQVAFGRWVCELIGFDMDRGRFDPSHHPFCCGLNRDDVRITWRVREQDFRPGVFGFLHEAGHGLYEQGLPERWQHTPLGEAPSLGLHESQSRLWENRVGRSRAFWVAVLPRFRQLFPSSEGLAVDALWPALNLVQPSPVRVDADETTYNLHVLARFELERSLVEGRLAVDELPQAWDDAYDRLLGLRPRDVVEGVLQDIHWATGLFGYFPTYTLGTLLSAQLYEAAVRELGDLEQGFARGELRPLLAWLREKIHGLGSRHEAGELTRLATGQPLGAAAFLAHVTATAREVYSL